jgi:hypothetical protein
MNLEVNIIGLNRKEITMLENSEPRPTKSINGPAADANSIKKAYKPVSCDFSDELENFSVRKILVDVTYWDDKSLPCQLTGVIEDIFTTPQKEEFLKLDNGELIRLDRIFEIAPHDRNSELSS